MWFKPVDIVYDNTYVIDFLNKTHVNDTSV